MIKLYQHQEIGVEFLLKHKKACLFYEVGTGKTFIGLESLSRLPPAKVLIVAPKRVLENVWKADKVYDLSKHNVTYLNYEKIARDKDFTKNKWDYIVLDEVHKLKGRSTKTSRKFTTICKKAEYVFGFTGTPVANSYVDVYNIYKHTDIQEFIMTYDEFVYRYYYTKSLESKTGFKFELLVAPKNYMIDELMERISNHSLVKASKDCIDLPEKRTNIVYVNGMVNSNYKTLKQGIFKGKDYNKTMIALETLGKLHQAANSFVYDAYGETISVCKNNKLIELNDLLEDMLEETEKVIVVYYFKEDLKQLKSLKYKYTTDPMDFPNNQILFLQFGQCEGLNLQYCNQMIFYSYDYSFLKYEQMCGRIYRSGQKNNVTYTVLISKGTVEEQIWSAIKNKKSKDDFLKDALKILGGSDE